MVQVVQYSLKLASFLDFFVPVHMSQYVFWYKNNIIKQETYKQINALFNDTLNTFYLRSYGVSIKQKQKILFSAKQTNIDNFEIHQSGKLASHLIPSIRVETRLEPRLKASIPRSNHGNVSSCSNGASRVNTLIITALCCWNIRRTGVLTFNII